MNKRLYREKITLAISIVHPRRQKWIGSNHHKWQNHNQNWQFTVYNPLIRREVTQILRASFSWVLSRLTGNSVLSKNHLVEIKHLKTAK
ncbi:hypothetical protein L4D76_19450 [Photobacterium sagamiensis]|uniref:hypothetical protein n=1 Tax=Photobacterium sagamiensis TaxID=2910241 RepID=UPI003D0B16FF